MKSSRVVEVSRWVAVLCVALLISACQELTGGLSSERLASESTVAATVAATDVQPVSASNPSSAARDALARCHVGDQYRIEQVSAMGEIGEARDLGHYVPVTGREPQLKDHGPAWVIQFKGDLVQRTEV
jgi:hypothetical protein